MSARRLQAMLETTTELFASARRSPLSDLAPIRPFFAGRRAFLAQRLEIGRLMDPRHYLSMYPDLTAADDLVDHYMTQGLGEGVSPNRIFDEAYYRARYARDSEGGSVSFLDFAMGGAQAGHAPNALFDVDWYIRRHELDDAQRANPLAHYLEEVRSRRVETSPLLDHAHYLRVDPDAALFGNDLLSAYLDSGLAKNLAPNPLFDGPWYCSRHGVSGGTAGALAHYLEGDNARRFDPHPLFDTRFYLCTNPDVAQSSWNPLAHFLDRGAARGLTPHPLFDPAHYAAQSDAPGNGLIDFLVDERNWDGSPHPLFDGGFYRRANPDVAASRINPLRHFVQSGASEGRRPCPLFWTEWYAATYPDAVRDGRNPLVDYVTEGVARGRNPNVVFDSDFYLARHGDVAAAGLNPLAHYVHAGAKEGRDPSPLFDARWYQARYPETNRHGVDPLEHYLGCGMAAGYDMRPVDRVTHDCDALEIPFEIVRDPGALTDREVCLFVTYAAEGRVEDHVLTTLRSYKNEGMALVLVVVTEGLSLPLNVDIDHADGIVVRINHGWDFAAWATALAVLPDLWSARLVILVNDSVYGPTSRAGLAALLDRVRASDKDVVALTDSYQVRRHMMSYFTALTPSGLRNASIRAFWNGIRSNRDKPTVIREYELKSIERCLRDGTSFEVLYPATSLEFQPSNPTLSGWRELIGRGFPFVKAQLLRDFIDTYEARDWAGAFDDARLVTQIEAHLARIPRHRPAAMRPVPSPKQRFIQAENLQTYYGALPGCRPSAEVDLALEVPFRRTSADLRLPDRVAVVVHVFYPDFCPVLLAALAAMPVVADVFVSTDTQEKAVDVAAALEGHRNGSVEIRVCTNVGRDIAPLLIAFGDVFARYEVFLHLHSKRSPHQADLAGWRDFLIANLVGSRETIRSILGLFADGHVGLVFSQHFPAVRELINFGHNFEAMQQLLARCGVALSRDLVLEFPSSSFFWGRSAAIRPLLDLGLAWSDFPAEAGQIDGTLAHAIERALLYVVEAAGFTWAKVADPGRIAADGLVPVQGADDMTVALARVHRPLLENRLLPHKETRFLSEVNRPLTRRDTHERPRLNLVVPTLQPAKMFGGLTTALRFFKQLAHWLGDEIDLRIITVNERVDMQSMLQLPEFRLVQVGAPADAFPKVVLDASERQRGYVCVRRNDIFIATAWWTAAVAFAMRDSQSAYFGVRRPLLYLIQDHEPNFYSWSSHFQEARQTYARPGDTIAILNSEEFANYLVRHYRFEDAFVLPFVLNTTIESALWPVARERIILVYGRPSVARNCFDALVAALGHWQRIDPIEAARWKIVSLGEDYDPVSVSQIQNLEVFGKVTLERYGEFLSRAAVGVSLMASPHPSYPPLEMAFAGLLTITNTFEGKDLSLRSPNVMAVSDLGAGTIATALAQAVRAAAPVIRKIVPTAPLADVACSVTPYDPSALASRLQAMWTDPPFNAASHAIASR